MILNPLIGNATAKNTIYTLTPKSISLTAVLTNIGIVGPIIFTQAGQQKKYNITQKAKSSEMVRMLDDNLLVYCTPGTNLMGFEFTFSPNSPTVQTLANLAVLQNSIGNIIFSMNVTNPVGLTTTTYPICTMLSPFSGFEENERTEDVTFEFKAVPPNMVNLGALTSLVGGLI